TERAPEQLRRHQLESCPGAGEGTHRTRHGLGHRRPEERLDAAFNVAALWLSEATGIAELTATPKLFTRAEWAETTMPVWVQLAEPVATSIADALTGIL